MGATQTYAVNNSLVRVFNDDNFAPVLRSASTSSPTFKSLSPRQEWQMLLMFQSVYCDDLFSNTDVMEEISHADIIVGEFIYLCSTLIADKFSLPLVSNISCHIGYSLSIRLRLTCPSFLHTTVWSFSFRQANIFGKSMESFTMDYSIWILHLRYVSAL